MLDNKTASALRTGGPTVAGGENESLMSENIWWKLLLKFQVFASTCRDFLIGFFLVGVANRGEVSSRGLWVRLRNGTQVDKGFPISLIPS